MGSLRKMKSDLNILVKYLRLNLLRRNPSIFHVNDEKDCEDDVGVGWDASATIGAELSELSSLNVAVGKSSPENQR